MEIKDSTFKKIEKVYRIVQTILLSIALVCFLLIIYWDILEPAYVSFKIACNETEAKELFPNWTVQGTTYFNSSGFINITIEEGLDKKQEIRVTKHEIVHANQIKNNVIFDCKEHPIIWYFNEVEAYTMQNLPDWIFYKFYTKEFNC
jgi:hypothetical protein